MATQVARTTTALLLVAAGVLLHVASWQRWAGACPVLGARDAAACDGRQDSRYDFLVVADPWLPAGNAAQLAGAAFLLVALALLLVPWALGARPRLLLRAGLVGMLGLSALAYASAGLGALWSGRAAQPVEPPLGDAGATLWLLLPAPALVWLAVVAAGWVRAAAVLLVLASPMVMFFTYAVGPFDSAPWYEAVCGDLTAVAGLCLVVAAVRHRSPRRAPTASTGRRPHLDVLAGAPPHG